MREFRVRSSVLWLYLFFINFLFLIFGILILALCVLVCLNRANTPEILGNYLFNAGVYVCLFVSLFLLMAPICGFVAKERKSRLLIILYLGLVVCIFLLTFCCGITLLVFPGPFESTILNTMNSSLTKNYGKKGIITDAWNYIQSQLRCCAVENNGWRTYRGSWWDYSVNSDFYDITSQLSESSLFYKHVPASCCLTLIEPLTGWPTRIYRNLHQCQDWQYGPPRFSDGVHNDAVYYRGCFTSLNSYLKRYSLPIGGMTLFISFIVLVAVICVALLLKNANRKSEHVKPRY